jgi:hypothetical protein
MRTTTRSIVLALSLFATRCSPLSEEQATAIFDGAASDATREFIGAPTPSPLLEDAPRALAFAAVLQEQQSWLVLDASGQDTGEGSPREIPASEEHQAATRSLRAEARARIPAVNAVRVFRGAGWLCDAVVDEPVELSLIEREYDEQGTLTSRPVEDVSALGITVVAAPLRAIRGRCEGGEWAQDLALPAPELAVAETASPSVAALAYEAMRVSSEGRALEAQHRERCRSESDSPCAASWDTRDDVSRWAAVFRSSDGRQWVFASARSNDPCGGFGANVSLFAELRETTNVSVLTDRLITTELESDPDTLLVPKVGERPELRAGGARLRVSREGEWSVDRTSVPHNGCGC